MDVPHRSARAAPRRADATRRPPDGSPRRRPRLAISTVSSMLERRLEPEVMDTPGEARDYDAMDHSAVNRAFVADFVEHWRSETPILDLGTGTALIPIEFYKSGSKSTRVVGVDLAAAMLDVGRG